MEALLAIVGLYLVLKFIYWLANEFFGGSKSGPKRNITKSGPKRYITKESPNETTVKAAVSTIEMVAGFVKENQYILDCNQITMWQYGEVGEGFEIEFYGYQRHLKSIIKDQLGSFVGMWDIRESVEDDMLNISCRYPFSYVGSWNEFNKMVWDEIERKHPEWKVARPYPQKCVLLV